MALEDARTRMEAVDRHRAELITGGWSPTYDAVGELTARLTGGRHVIVPSPDHFVMTSNPSEFNAAVETFWLTARGA